MLVQNHMIVCTIVHTDRVQRTFENSTEFYEVRATNDAVWWLLQVSCKHSKDSIASKILMIYTSTCRLDIRAVGMLKIFVGTFKDLEQVSY